jgi:hypothetical protein
MVCIAVTTSILSLHRLIHGQVYRDSTLPSASKRGKHAKESLVTFRAPTSSGRKGRMRIVHQLLLCAGCAREET